ncbi:MAG: arylesterase [Verrucomicrobiota bacterium]
MKVSAKMFDFYQWCVSTLILLALAIASLAQSPTASVSASVGIGAERKTIVVFGDSLAAGFGLDLSEAFPALLQRKIDKVGWNFSVINAGVSGDTSAGGLRRIDWVLKRKVDLLLLELGGNDGLRGIPVEVTKTNLQAIIDRSKQKHPRLQIVIAAMQMPPNMGDEYKDAFQNIFPDLAKANNAALVPFLLEGVGGKPELNLPDRIHPTADGHKIVAENVWKILQPALEKMGPIGP